MRIVIRSVIGALIGALVSPVLLGHVGARKGDAALYTETELAAIYSHSPLGSPPPDPTNEFAENRAAARLGQFLFFDRALSADDRVACATCHQPARAFADGRRLAKGLAVGTRNTPTVLNSAFDQWFFWDGRTDSSWSQALKPFENPREAGSDRLYILHLVADYPALRSAYRQVFGPLPELRDRERFPLHARPDEDPHLPVAQAWARMSLADRTAVDRAFSNLGKAIEAYERELVDGGSAFDRYVSGLKSGDLADQRAISPAAKRGLRLFVGSAHCELCHSGPTFSDGQFHNLGLPLLPGEVADAGRALGIREVLADPFNGRGEFSDARRGASDDRLAFLPSPASELGAFKTPSLRDVALTAPYMHDGRFATLRQVLDFYAEGEAASHGRLTGERERTADLVPHLNESQKGDLIAFLKTLTGKPPPAHLTRPPGWGCVSRVRRARRAMPHCHGSAAP